MIDWLRRNSREDPKVEVAGQLIPVVLRRSAQAKRMTMRLAPDGSEVRITLPRWGRSEEALDFARKRAGWLAGQLAAVPPKVELGDGAMLPYLGLPRTIVHDPRAPRRIVLSDEAIQLGGPAESLSTRLTRWLEGEALRLLTEDLAHYCEVAAQPVPKLGLSRARRRWGSCAHDGTIRINWRLVMAPGFVRRSVVAHEVAHLVHFDHSPEFHAFLDRIFEHDIRAANRWLKREGRQLYVPLG
ncbi:MULTISPECIES: SprT family zinc-dependent metalloprotease [unclassified Novosphingobium]|uniref:M48 family metallopeptidase n=1 Tax=unclassified Novosphingobium TaxID=2644732 RepID=UPI0025FB38F3|nr:MULTISPECIES: SprT family zinc-dependent metalloprotease [unclassified Novosphingobium]HQV02199.1 SprT family zinc-dependent metalloprotease [Novosphingobium sp.]